MVFFDKTAETKPWIFHSELWNDPITYDDSTSDDNRVEMISQVIENEGFIYAVLQGYRNGNYRKAGDTHQVLILEFNEETNMFLISDSDAPYNGIQGQFVWVSAEIIAQSFDWGMSVK